jgi:hypothetical protein
MTTELQTYWRAYLNSMDRTNSSLNDPITENEINLLTENFKNFPTTLLDLLQISNGQKPNSSPFFIKLTGSTISKYKYLNAVEIISLYKFIQDSTQGSLSKDLIPFAKYEKDIGDKGSMAFAINSANESIYHLLFYEYDRFTTIYEHRAELFSKSLLDFIQSESEWRQFTSC